MAGRSAWPGSLGVWTALWKGFVTLRIRRGVRIRARPPLFWGLYLNLLAKVFSYVTESKYFSRGLRGLATRIGFDSLRFAREVRRHRIVRQSLQTRNHALGVKFCARPARMSMWIGKQCLHLSLAKSVVAASDDLVEIDESDVLLDRHLSSPATIVLRVARDLPILPGLPRNGRADDRSSFLGDGIGNVLMHVPAVAVNSLVPLEDWILDLPGLLANTRQRAAGAGSIVQGPRVIMTKLEQNDIARLHQRQRVIPVALGDVGAAAAAADGSVDDVDL